MKTKKQEKLINYMLTVGFIFLLIIFLSSIVLISRYVLSSSSSIGEQVLLTQNLLDDIDEVKEITTKQENQTYLDKINNFNISDKSFDFLTELYVLNINEHKSFLTLTFNGTIIEKGDFIYLYNKNLVYNLDDFVILDDNLLYKIVEVNKDSIKVISNETKTIKSVSKADVAGKLIVKK